MIETDNCMQNGNVIQLWINRLFAVGGWYNKEEQKCSELSAQWMKKLQN